MDQNMNTKIKNLVEKSDVCLFMKGTPEVPQCGFSLAVANVLKHLNIKYNSVNVLEDAEVREGIKKFSDWPTIPQLYVKGEFIGGCDIIKEMIEKGELQNKLKEKNISFKDN
jgi:monothiol glutaredoxin